MIFKPISQSPAHAPRLLRFLELVGEELWWKRYNQLAEDAQSSMFLWKTVVDHHWLEVELGRQASCLLAVKHFDETTWSTATTAALEFASVVVEAFDRFSPPAQKVLLGRLRDALKGSFSGLFLEFDVARELLTGGYDVEFMDFEGRAQFDLLFTKGLVSGEVECKSLSVDAGRKIHRKDYYRFAHALAKGKPQFQPGLFLVEILVTKRLPADMQSMDELQKACLSCIKTIGTTVVGSFFEVVCVHLKQRTRRHLPRDQEKLYRLFRKLYGEHCHVTSMGEDDAGAFIVMRSRGEDDTSLPALNAIKQACKQLSKTLPGFVAVQYEDLKPADLSLPHLRRRMSILDLGGVYLDPEERFNHVAAIYHCCFDGLFEDKGRTGKPAFVTWNPRWSGDPEGLPFREGQSYADFSKMLSKGEKGIRYLADPRAKPRRELSYFRLLPRRLLEFILTLERSGVLAKLFRRR